MNDLKNGSVDMKTGEKKFIFITLPRNGLKSPFKVAQKYDQKGTPLLANFRGISSTDFWRTYPIAIFRFFGHDKYG